MSPAAVIPKDGQAEEERQLISLLSGSLKVRYSMDRDLNSGPQMVTKGSGNYLTLKNGRRIFDAAGGAAVAALGYGNTEVLEAQIRQMQKVSYCNSQLFTTASTTDLAQEIIAGTGFKMSKVLILSSGLLPRPHSQ